MTDPDSGAREDFWIFRDGRNTVRGEGLLRDLRLSLQCILENPRDQKCLLKRLVQSGEFESALADRESSATSEIAKLTSALGAPEGFSHYALHPLDFARTAEQIADSSCSVAVLGVRSIGTTLSEVATAVLEMVTHGDDHFFRGPCNIAWDLAGTAVE
jgi:hypothetical protein